MKREIFPIDLKYKPSDKKIILAKKDLKTKDIARDNSFVETVRKLF